MPLKNSGLGEGWGWPSVGGASSDRSGTPRSDQAAAVNGAPLATRQTAAAKMSFRMGHLLSAANCGVHGNPDYPRPRRTLPPSARKCSSASILASAADPTRPGLHLRSGELSPDDPCFRPPGRGGANERAGGFGQATTPEIVLRGRRTRPNLVARARPVRVAPDIPPVVRDDVTPGQSRAAGADHKREANASTWAGSHLFGGRRPQKP